MNRISAARITETVKQLCMDANYYLNDDIKNAVTAALENETSETGKQVLQSILKNAEIAAAERIPICQDTGMAVVFAEVGADVCVTDGFIGDAINEGVKQGYTEGYLRASVVGCPVNRINTKDNTPAVIHYELVPGDHIKLTIAPKGFGSENMSKVKMFNPSASIEDIEAFVEQCVRDAGGNPCPPIIVGVGIGGTFEKAALMSKKALLRPLGTRTRTSNTLGEWDEVEIRMLRRINKIGVGPGGFGGGCTALGVHIETFPTHIAGLPVAVNIGCHATRHRSEVLR